MGSARVFKYALQPRVQGKRIDGVKKRLRNDEAVSVVPAPFYACRCISGYRYVRENEGYEMNQNGPC